LKTFENENLENYTSALPEKNSGEKTYLPYLHDLVTLIAGVILVFTLLFRVVVVSGPSMNNTLIDGDWLLLLGNVIYSEPVKGDIIVASKDTFDDGAPIIKRVIAKEGEKVDIDFDGGIVYVNDIALDEPYTLTPTNMQEGMEFPLIVEKGCIFVMGDNRNVSKDSRSMDIGLIDCREVLGKALFLFFPGNNQGYTERDFNRIGAVS
jgi:signal peptidase I